MKKPSDSEILTMLKRVLTHLFFSPANQLKSDLEDMVLSIEEENMKSFLQDREDHSTDHDEHAKELGI